MDFLLLPSTDLFTFRLFTRVTLAKAARGRPRDTRPVFELHKPVLKTSHLCVSFCIALQRAAPENGILVIAYHVLHTGHSRSKQSRPPESTWN